MNCSKCGAPLPEKAKFCSSCGCKIRVPSPQNRASAAAKKKPGLPVLIAGAAVVAAAVLAVLFFVVRPEASGTAQSACATLQDERFVLIKGSGKGDTIEIADTQSDADGAVAWFSEDGKYFYFFTRYDSSNYTGTLCRAEWEKLTENTAENAQYIQTIASDVRATRVGTTRGVQEMKNDTLLYRNVDKTLYYFDGRESVRVAENVTGLYPVDGDDSQVLYISDEEGLGKGGTLYSWSLDKPGDPVRIDCDVGLVTLWKDLNNIVYVVYGDGDQDRLDLYTAGLSKAPEKIASGVTQVAADEESNSVFYCEDSGNTLAAYEFLNDASNADGDARYWNYGIQLFDLYCLKDGSTTRIAEDIISAKKVSGGYLYWGRDAFTTGLDTGELEDTTEILDAVAGLDEKAVGMLDLTGMMLYDCASGQTFPLADTNDKDLTGHIANGSGYTIGSSVFVMADRVILIDRENGSLLQAPIENGVLGRFTSIAQDVSACSVKEGVLYYMAACYDKGDDIYGDLYSDANGQSSCIAQDILMARVAIYEDGGICGYTGHDDDGYELACIKADGTKSVLAEEVTDYIRADVSTLLYISDGDLYRYDGKSKTLVAEDVDGVWSASALTPQNELDLH